MRPPHVILAYDTTWVVLSTFQDLGKLQAADVGYDPAWKEFQPIRKKEVDFLEIPKAKKELQH